MPDLTKLSYDPERILVIHRTYVSSEVFARRRQPRWLSSPTHAIAAFGKPAGPLQARPLEVRLRAGYRNTKKLGLCSLGLAVEYDFDAGMEAYDLNNCQKLEGQPSEALSA